MKKKANRRRIVRSSQFIAYISVALLLLILGIVALAGITTRRVTDSIRSSIGVVAMVDEASYPESAARFKTGISANPWVAEIIYTDAATVLDRWKKLMGDDCADMLDINPFLPEYEIRVKPGWASADSINAIIEKVKSVDCVYDVKAHSELVGNVNNTIRSVILTLLILAAVLTIIAVVLVHNMVRMEIYAHRQTIHTMKYVGATNGFIRMPYVSGALTGGAIAGVVASAILAGVTYYAGTLHSSIAETLSWPWVACVCVALIVTGAMLCTLSALLATSKYLRKSHDEIFN